MKVRAPASALGALIRQRREALGLTQAEVAGRGPGLTRSTVAALEVRPPRDISAKILSALSQALEISIDELYGAAGLNPQEESRDESWEELYERARLRAPRAVPLYAVFPSDGRAISMVGRIYREVRKPRSHRLEAYLLNEDGPENFTLSGYQTLVVVDWNENVKIGDWVLCTYRGAMRCGELKDVGGELWVQTKSGPVRMAECESPVLIEEFVLSREHVAR